jgi:PKD repeat protein
MTFDGSGSYDLDGTIISYFWDFGDGTTGSGGIVTHTYAVEGAYQVTLAVIDTHGAGHTASISINVIKQLTSLDPAQVWIGIKNSDAVGIKFDLKAEVYKDGVLVTSGHLDSVSGGSSGFGNANLNTIPFTNFSPIDFPTGSSLSVKVSARNACVGSGKNSGTARLWFNDSAANSQFGATITPNTDDYYLLDGLVLGISAGPGPKKNIDVAAGAKCSPFKPFGTWQVTPN